MTALMGWRAVALSPFCVEGAVVLAAVKDAARRSAVAFGHP
jgi:2-methylaconitate cis-trans-isomerase PrpF